MGSEKKQKQLRSYGSTLIWAKLRCVPVQ